MGTRAQLFAWMWLFIGIVSAYDAYLVVKYAASIRQMEQNPLGLYLIKLNDGDVWLFVHVKALGTAGVLAALTLLYHCSRRFAYPVTTSVTGFQFMLLLYLTFA